MAISVDGAGPFEQASYSPMAPPRFLGAGGAEQNSSDGQLLHFILTQHKAVSHLALVVYEPLLSGAPISLSSPCSTMPGCLTIIMLLENVSKYRPPPHLVG